EPHRVVASLRVLAVLDATVDRHHAGLVGARDLPGRAVDEPVIRLLALLAVLDLLAEEPELVVDAVAVAGHVQGGHRIEEARGEAPEAAVAERGVRLERGDLLEVDAETARDLGRAT